MSQLKKLTKALIDGKITEAEMIAKNIILSKALTKINELKARKKFVIRGGKKIKKFIGKKGMTQKNGILTKTDPSKLAKKKKSAKRGAITAKKGAARKALNQKKSLRKRNSMGIK